MSNLVRYTGPAVEARTDRRMSRALAQIDGQTEIGLAHLDQAEELEQAKVKSFTRYTTMAAAAAARMAEVEMAYCQESPGTAHRVARVFAVGQTVLEDLVEHYGCTLMRMR